MCNEKVKFGNLWAKARAIGARVHRHRPLRASSSIGPDGAVLRKGRDPRKDQSYFLFSLRQEQLARALFPLGGMEKTEIRAIARQLGLKTADKVDSQEICFVPGNDYKAFLKGHLGAGEFHPGGIYDKIRPPARRARGHRDVHHRPAQRAARRERRAALRHRYRPGDRAA